MAEVYHVGSSCPLISPSGCADTSQYEKKLADYNMGTLVRRDSNRNYAEDNAILVTRAQFVAIEVSEALYSLGPPSNINLDRQESLRTKRQGVRRCPGSEESSFYIACTP